MQAPWWWSKTETCRSDIYVYFNVNFNVFFKIKKWICWWLNTTYTLFITLEIKTETVASNCYNAFNPSLSESSRGRMQTSTTFFRSRRRRHFLYTSAHLYGVRSITVVGISPPSHRHQGRAIWTEIVQKRTKNTNKLTSMGLNVDEL